MIDIRFRQSVLKKWMECPLQAFFAEIQGLPRIQGSKATFGTCIHSALHHYNQTGDADESIRLFLEVWDNPAELGMEIAVWNKYTTFGGLRMKGVEILKTYHDRMRWEQRTIVAMEHTFLVPFGEHELTGTVDLVSLRKNHRGRELVAVEDYKCLAWNVPVLLPDGTTKRASCIDVGDMVVGDKSGVLVPTRVEEVFDNGIRSCLRVTTFAGRTVDVTPEHPFQTPEGWTKAADLVPCHTATAHNGSRVKVALGWEGIGEQVPPREAWLLGALIGDGCISGSNFSLTNIDPHILEMAESVVTELGFLFKQYAPLTWGITNKSGRKSVSAWRTKHSLYGASRTKIVPPEVQAGGTVSWIAFLGGYLSTDGSVRVTPSPVICWHSVNRELLMQCQQMVACLGVKGRIEKIRAATVEGYSYRLTVADRWGVGRLADMLRPWTYGPKRERLFQLGDAGEQPEMYPYEAVESVKVLPARPTIGIQVTAGTHITGGLVTHNTNARKPNLGELALNIQFTTYIYATLQREFWFGHPGSVDFRPVPNAEWYWETLQDVPRRGIWVQLWNDCQEMDAGPRDLDDFQRLYRLCNEIEQAIEHNVYVPMIGSACTLCDYANGPCPVEIPTRTYWEAERPEADENAWL